MNADLRSPIKRRTRFNFTDLPRVIGTRTRFHFTDLPRVIGTLCWLCVIVAQAAMGETPGNRSPNDDLRGAAFHEAGHVVVARHLGLTVGVIEIGVDGDPAKGKAEISDDDQLSLIDQLALCAAGIEAQEMFDAPTHDVAGFGEGVKMFNLLEDIPVEQRKALRFAGYGRAIEILKEHRAEVELLADRLLREKRITGWP